MERDPDPAGENPVAVGFSGRTEHTMPAQPGDAFVVRLISDPVGGPVLTLPGTAITRPAPTESSPLRFDEPVLHTYQPPASCHPG